MSFDYTKPASKRIPMDAGCGNCRYCEQKNDETLCCSTDMRIVEEDGLCSLWQGKPLQMKAAGRLLQ